MLRGGICKQESSGWDVFSRGAFKDKSFGEDVFSGGALKGLVEVLARIRHAWRICLAAEVLSRMSHAGRMCLAEQGQVLLRMRGNPT